MKKTLENIIREKILVLDGGVATSLKKYRIKDRDFKGERFKNHDVDLSNFYEMLNFTKVDIVKDAHEKFIKAGADIISTNTFRANRIELKKYKLDEIAYELNYTSAMAARELTTKYSNITRDKPRYVAGVIGPISSKEATLDEMEIAYSEQIKGLMAGKVDVILLETVFEEDNIKAALFALEAILKKRRKNFPMIISGAALENNKALVTGELIKRYTSFIHHVRILAIGMNCGSGPEQILEKIKNISYTAPYNIIAYPNAGLPNEKGKYEIEVDTYIESIKKFIDKNLVNIIGGCCGVRAEHIKKISKLVKGVKPRKI